jgi:peptidoglycan/xylan/chitin deacetylase (PgdA/CDA1 family)
MPAFRADRLATLYFFHPLARLRPHGTRIPILMYHSISDVDDSSRHPYYRTVTAPRVFDRQLQFLHDRGYKTISLSEAVQFLRRPEADVEKTIVITFDDGFKDFYTSAFPILSRYGYSATVFLPTAYIGQASRFFNGVECLTWNQVRELRKAGVEFGSHTVTHPQLRGITMEQVRAEVGRSKDNIEEKLGERVETFAYPYAFPETDREFVETLRRTLQESGYRSGVTTIIGRLGPLDIPLFMRRLPINSHDDQGFFQAKLEGGYDWLRAAQYASKAARLGHRFKTTPRSKEFPGIP